MKYTNKNVINHIINASDQSTHIDDGQKRYTLGEIFARILEGAAATIMFGVLIYFLSISDSLDQHLMEWMGR